MARGNLVKFIFWVNFVINFESVSLMRENMRGLRENLKHKIRTLVQCHEGERIDMQTKRLPFQCPICEVRFTKKESLDSHLSEDHKDENIPKVLLHPRNVKKRLAKTTKNSEMEIVIKSENADYDEYEDYENYYDPDLEIKQEIHEGIHESSEGFHPNSSIKEEWDSHDENPEGFLEDYEQGNLLRDIVNWSVAA